VLRPPGGKREENAAKTAKKPTAPTKTATGLALAYGEVPTPRRS
jgi:hypothetical protein